ncbi:homoserine dehydrogenase [Wohlfahrtiimonas sp. G9077]|uniref:homoserine dehydrogenase n=1 Tax=Wohlfahrtiimonas sp. G9077 TaxID=1980118 RepID=UPI000B97DC9A|nr:homoserine dehydrogenase [Wohlfahrtiimonas sp. G9077]OYQ75548.1 homoserine dehydrogenase [Wohlfahrtiimonas sp. G9077]
MKRLNIGILGFGTVATGVVDLIKENHAEITRRTGYEFAIEKIFVRSMDRDNPYGLSLTTDVNDVLMNPNIDVVVELMGGIEPSLSYIQTALDQNKHVITANKALIATHGNELFKKAAEKGLMLMFEASVAGGIPVIKTLRESLIGNKIESLAGIINGTGNYILTEMKEKGRSFEDALKDAQALGYAEADPTFDVEGIDAAHKLTILASIAFGIPLQFDKVFVEGISTLETEDIQYANQLGYTIKHLGIAKYLPEGIEIRVHPTLIPKSELISNVNGVMNAVLVKANGVGPVLSYGAGAGGKPTASSVLSDLADISRMLEADKEHYVPYLAFQNQALSNAPILPQADIHTAYYLRIKAVDQPGVLSDITHILAQHDISIELMIQTKSVDDNLANIIMTTHETKEHAILESLRAIEALANIRGKAKLLRIESFRS